MTADLVECSQGFTAATETTNAGTDADIANLDYLDHLAGTADCETINRVDAPALAPQFGTAGADRMIGDASANFLLGLRGNDVLSGFAGRDELHGGVGNDKLLGGGGSDTLFGRPGVDRLDGNAGRDFLVSRSGDRGDIVTCTRTRVRTQRDVVVAGRGDIVRNAAFCARVTFT